MIVAKSIATKTIFTLIAPFLFSAVSEAQSKEGAHYFQLNANSIPLEKFISYAFDEFIDQLVIDDSVKNYPVSGEYTGSVDDILISLAADANFEYSLQGDYLSISMHSPERVLLPNAYDLSVFDLSISELAYRIADRENLALDVEYGLDINVSGTLSGSLEDVFKSLSSEYPILINKNQIGISIVSSRRSDSQKIELSDSFKEDRYVVDLLASDVFPSNSIEISGKAIIISGHPEFVQSETYKLVEAQTNFEDLIDEPVVPGDISTSSMMGKEVSVPAISLVQSELAMKILKEAEADVISSKEPIIKKPISKLILKRSNARSTPLRGLEAIPGFY